MPFFLRQIIHACLGVSLLVCVSTTPRFADSRTLTASALMPEVRLRKIHLVRPDLIPYPIAYEIDC